MFQMIWIGFSDCSFLLWYYQDFLVLFDFFWKFKNIMILLKETVLGQYHDIFIRVPHVCDTGAHIKAFGHFGS